MRVMFEDGLDKVLSGTTTLDEVFRVAKQSE
jgi:type II secretory ATPase GspE/PulE/Tfp pilus assembly ATPase PilB-like protein